MVPAPGSTYTATAESKFDYIITFIHYIQQQFIYILRCDSITGPKIWGWLRDYVYYHCKTQVD